MFGVYRFATNNIHIYIENGTSRINYSSFRSDIVL